MCQFFKFTAIFSITACGTGARRLFFREQESLLRLPLRRSTAARPLPRLPWGRGRAAEGGAGFHRAAEQRDGTRLLQEGAAPHAGSERPV